MALTFESYYGTNGELIKAYNLAEPFTVNDLHQTSGVSEVETIETWFSCTWQELYNETMAVPNSLGYQIGATPDSIITLESGVQRAGLAARYRYDNQIPTIEERELGIPHLPYVWKYNNNTQYVNSLRLDIEYGNDVITARTTVIDGMVVGYNPYDVEERKFQTNQSYGSIVIVRDYTGHIFTVKISAIGSSRTGTGGYNRNNFSHIELEEIAEFPEWMDREFWQGLTDSTGPDIEEGEGIVDINERFAPRVGMMGMGIYPMYKEDLQDFIYDLWTETFAEKILKFVNGDVMNNVISIRWFYGIGGSIPRTEDHAYLRLGNQSMKGDLGTRTVTTRPAKSELMTYSMGSLTVPRKYNNFLDLSPFTRLQVFVPYVGFVTLDMTEFAGRRLRLDYNINIVSGAAIAYIYVQNSDGSWRIAYEQATSIGVEIPLSINSRESMATRMTTAIAGTAVTAGGAAIGSMLGPVGALGGAMAGAGVSQEVLGSAAQTASNGISGLSSTFSSSPSSRNGGGIDNETGSLGEFQPSILITRPKAIPPSDYNMQVGLPDNNSGTVGSFNGYIKAGAIKQTSGIGIPRQAMDEIDQMLRAGVYTQ